MISHVMHPGLILILGGLMLAFCKDSVRAKLALLLPLLVLYLVWQVPDGAAWHASFLQHTLTPLQGDKLSRLFATIFSLAAFGGALFAFTQKSRIEVPAAFVYAGSAIGVVFAGDLITVFVFWELMAIGSTLVLWSTGDEKSYQSARRYLMVHLFGGVVLFAGITGHIVNTGDVTFTKLMLDSPAQWLILAGFLINAGAPPFSAWLPDAYPEASWSGAVFLSAFTTKTAVYVLIRGFPGAEVLIGIGLFMVFYGIVYALLENDMRRILAYSIVSQVGFMVTAVGIGTEMALNGAAAHAFAHIIYKALLLMSAGSVLMMTNTRNCTSLGGLYRTMPLTATCGIIGALAISAFPLTSGFISKSMIAQAAADSHLQWVWMLLAAASAGTLFYAGLKFTWFVFFQKDSGLRPEEPPKTMRWAMMLFAVLCIALGVWPEALYALLPYPVAYVPYTATHIVAQLQMMLFVGLAFFILLPYISRTLTITLDSDWLWRKLLPMLANGGDALLGGLNRLGKQVLRVLSAGAIKWAREEENEGGWFTRSWPTSTMALWVLVILLAYLVGYYI